MQPKDGLRNMGMVSNFSFEEQKIPGLFLITPFFSEDERGYFKKNYEKEIFQKAGLEADIFEEFESLSHRNVIRGLHFQSQWPQTKIVRTIFGEIFDVAVDLRKNSETFGEWKAVYLSGENRKLFYIPAGFAHGFMVVSDKALVSYMCVGKYYKEYDTGIRWDDPDIGIKWPLRKDEKPVLSERDKRFGSLKEYRESLQIEL